MDRFSLKNASLILMALTLTACGDTFKAVTGYSLGSGQCIVNSSLLAQSKISKNSPLLEEKVNTQSLSADSNEMLVAGTELVALIDNACLENTGGEWADDFAQSSDPVASLNMQAYTTTIDSEMSMEDLQDQMANEPCIASVEKQMYFQASAVPNDTRFAEQGYLADIKAADAWDIFYDPATGINADQEVVIAVVDTGVDYTHPDLANKMWTNNNNEFGFDFANNDTDPRDDNFHGTHVAGLAAAQANNNMGIAGVMNGGAQIMAVKTLDQNGAGTLNDVVNGILYAANNGADIINLSLGAPGASVQLQEAMQMAVQLGSLVVVAASNEGVELSAVNFISPASYAKDIDGVISVGSTDANTRTLSSFSNYSSTYVELAAPGDAMNGGGIISTFPNAAFNSIQGTSMATPLVAGAAGLSIGYYGSQGKTLSPGALEELLLAGSEVNATLVNRIKDNKHLDLVALANHVQSTSNVQVLKQPETQRSLIGQNAILEVEISTDFGVTYQWQKDGVNITGATESRLVIPNASTDDNGEYRVIVDQFGGQLTSQSATLTMVRSCN